MLKFHLSTRKSEHKFQLHPCAQGHPQMSFNVLRFNISEC